MSMPPAGLEVKTAVLDRPATATPSVTVSPLGVVTALVAVTGIRDRVGDIITPGAFARTLRERKAHPRLLHNWNRRIGHTLDLRELLPGDASLPTMTPDGQPWPREAGALLARFQVDKSIKDGRRALAWAQGRLGTPPWYSIGYVPINPRRLGDTRHLDDLELWEYSMVHHPANGLATQVDVKSLTNLVDSEHQLPPESIEVKVRYVRDASYWGYAVGTPITATMKPKGKTALRLRRAGRVPARTVGVSADKPAEGARSTPAKPDEEAPEGLFAEPATEARVRASAAATGDIEGAVTSLIMELEDRHGDVDRAIPGLLHEGETPAELEEDLRANETWSADGDEREDLITSALAEYRRAYQARAKQQAERREAAARWEPPSRETFDRIADAATTAFESFEDKPLIAALADLGHEDPEGFAAFLIGEDTSLKKARTALESYLDERRALTESSGDIGERIGDLSDRDDQDLLDLRRTVADDLGTEDEALMAAAEAAVDAEIERRGIIAIGDVKPGDVFEFDGQRYYVTPDGYLVDPEGEASNLPRTGYQGRPAKLIERDAPAPLRKVDVEQLAATDAHVVTDAPAGQLSPAEFTRERQRADARRARAKNIADEREQAAKEAGYAAAADALADAAPAQLDLAALQARRQLIGMQSERRRPVELAAGGRLAIVGAGSKGWSIVAGNGMALVHALSFDETRKGGKQPGKRAVADLANRLASLADAKGRPVPFTATVEQAGEARRGAPADWSRGWRDGEGRSLPQAVGEVISAWAGENDLTFRYTPSNYRNEPTVPGGAPDAEGFAVRRADEIAPGDEIRLPDGKVGTVDRTGKHDYGLGGDQIILTDETLVRIPQNAGPGDSMPVRFADDPDTPEARQDPGMGSVAATTGAPPGQPIKIAPDQWEKRWPYDYDRPQPEGTRFVMLPPVEPSTLDPRDERPRVGVVLARLDHAGDKEFQTVRFDDGTFDQLSVEGMRRTGAGPKYPTYVLDPTPEQVNAARAAWGLPEDENAGPGGSAPRPPPAPFVPIPQPEPEYVPPTPREQETQRRIDDGVRAYGRWVREVATDEELAEEERIVVAMRTKMPGDGPSNAAQLGRFDRSFVQPVRKERERRAAQRVEPTPEPEPPPAPEPAPPPAPEPAPPPTVEIPAEQLDEAAVLTDEVLGLLEQPDGSLEVTPEVGDRQDRVAALLDGREAGSLDLHLRSTDQLTGDRGDLRAELELQTTLERRAPRMPQPPRAPGEPREATPAEPGVRPGLVGAAQDHAEALRSGDPAAIARTKARLESSLRRSRAGSQAARQLADHVNDANVLNDSERIEALANLIREETRARRAAGARKRRTVRRLERERIRSLLGEVEAELGARSTAKFDADLAALTELDKHRHDTAKRIGAMIVPAEMWVGGMGPYHKKRVLESLRVGDYSQARNRVHTLRDLHTPHEATLDPDIFRALDDAELGNHELSKVVPFPPATGGTPAKRAALNRGLLGAVQGLDPEAVRWLRAVKIERRRKIGDISADAWYSWGPHHLSVVTDLFDDPASVQHMERNEGSGWFTTSGFSDYFTRSLHHEFGHHLHSVARQNGRERAMFDEVAVALGLPTLGAGDDLTTWHERHSAVIVDRVATYAGHSHFELIAELWTEYRGRGADAQPAAQVVGRVLSRPLTPGAVLPPVPAPEPVAPSTPMSDTEYASRVVTIESAMSTALADGRATDRQFTVNGEGQVWLVERARAHREVIEALWSRGQNVPNEGRALFSGGLGGAGKGTVLKRVVDQNAYFTINSDDVKEEMAARGMIPEVPGLTPMESVALIHEESGYLANLLAARAYAERKNVLWDVTMGSPGGTRRRVADLKQAGYTEINAVFVDIPVEVSVSRALERHRRGLERHRNGEGHGGRFVPPEVIRAHASITASSVNREVFDGLRGEFDSWAVYDNSVYGRPPELIDGVGPLAGQSALPGLARTG